MIPKILHLYGPLYINSYGFFIALSVLLFLWLGKRDPKRASLLTDDQFLSLLMFGIASGVIGGRILFLLSNWQNLDHFYEAFEIWNGGFSILGSIICVLFTASLYLWYNGLKLLRILDFAAVYAPLMQSISRIGCFFAGCCHGKPTDSILGVVYTHPLSAAPNNVQLHPTQLYSALALFGIFLCIYYLARNVNLKPGQLACSYLAFASIERFFLDFMRGDRGLASNSYLSFNQWVAILIFVPAISCFFARSYYTKKL